MGQRGCGAQLRFWAGVCAALILPAGPAFAQAPPAPQPRGWLFNYSISPTAQGLPLKGGDQQLDVAIWNGIARISVRSGALRAMTGEGGVMLLRASDNSVAVINPVRREALTGAMADLGAMMGGPGASVPIEVVRIESRTRLLGAGIEVLGAGTRRAELTQRYTIRVRAQGATREALTEQVMTIDLSRSIARLDAGFRVFAAQFARGVGLPESVRAKLRAAERGIPVGFPVQTTTVGLSVIGTDTLQSITRTVMKDLRQEPIDTMTFLVPAGFRVSEISRLLQQRRRP